MYGWGVEHKPLRLTNALVEVAAALVEKHEERHWGYELAKRTNVKPNALYGVLTRLHERDWLSDGWEEVPAEEKRPPRRYYQVTPLGLARLGALLAQASQDRRFARLYLRPGIAQ